MTSQHDWTCSLWLPLSQVFARLYHWRSGQLVKSNEEIPLKSLQGSESAESAESTQKLATGESAESTDQKDVSKSKDQQSARAESERSIYVLRVYSGPLVSSLGLWGGPFALIERACCMLEPGEEVEYEGGIQHTTKVRSPVPFKLSFLSSSSVSSVSRSVSRASSKAGKALSGIVSVFSFVPKSRPQKDARRGREREREREIYICCFSMFFHIL